MSNKIKLNSTGSESSYWISNDAQTFYTVPVNKQFESENIEDVIHALISEFSQSDNEQKKKYVLLLREWLNQMDDSILQINETEKIRDLIYEMF